MANKKTIKCVINERFSVMLDNVRMTQGHDDSLPFNSELFVYDREEETGCYKRFGNVFNDGWGGECEIDLFHTRYEKTINELKAEIEKNTYKFGEEECPITLTFLLDCMAAAALDGRLTLTISQLVKDMSKPGF